MVASRVNSPFMTSSNISEAFRNLFVDAVVSSEIYVSKANFRELNTIRNSTAYSKYLCFTRLKHNRLIECYFLRKYSEYSQGKEKYSSSYFFFFPLLLSASTFCCISERISSSSSSEASLFEIFSNEFSRALRYVDLDFTS